MIVTYYHEPEDTTYLYKIKTISYFWRASGKEEGYHNNHFGLVAYRMVFIDQVLVAHPEIKVTDMKQVKVALEETFL